MSNKMALDALTACPFCGKSNTLVIGKASDVFAEPDECGDPLPYMHTESYAVTCDASKPDGPGGCGASGGYKLTEELAVAAWNERAAIAALQAEPQPMDTAPKDGTRFLAWYPKHRLDEDDNPTGEPIGGAWAITSNNGGMWDEPDFLSAAGAWFFDDWCFADEPTRWKHLPPDVDAALPATPPKD